MEPTIFSGNHHQDKRGIVRFNNDFNALGIKRIYTLENSDTEFIRAWQGHKIEQRWFSATIGSFKIKLIKIDSWEYPSNNLTILEFILDAENLDILHVPAGYVSAIQSLQEESKLLVFADYAVGEVDDEYRFSADYFS